jgi:hypothetical protein
VSAGAYRAATRHAPDHIQEVRSTEVEPYTTGLPQSLKTFPAEI